MTALPQPTEPFWTEDDIICQYTRTEAIADGVLADVTAAAKAVGFRCSVVVTASVAAMIGDVPEGCPDSAAGRLHDILWRARLAFVGGRLDPDRNPRADFSVSLPRPEGDDQFDLAVHAGYGDAGEPAVTILRWEED